MKKILILVLGFSILITPFAPAFAQETPPPPPPSAPVADSKVDQPEKQPEPVRNDEKPKDVKAPNKDKSPVKKPIKDVDKDDPSLSSPQRSSLNSLSSGGASSSGENSAVKLNLLKADTGSGALVYNYPISVPPGRNGLQPDVSLNYNHQNSQQDNIVGYGWSINIPSIERINRKGNSTLYSDNYFTSSLSGELVSTGSSSYIAQVNNGEFLTYSFSGNTWLVKDELGNQYKFGYGANSRQDDPNDSSRIYKWMLDEYRDTNDNYIKYTYYKDNGQIYPDVILYSGNGSTDGIFEVDFLRSSRSDIISSYQTGFLVTSHYIINEIDTKVNAGWVRKSQLGYTMGDNGGRSLLHSITQSGKDDSGNVTVLPPTTFEYQTKSPNWTEDTSRILPNGSDGSPVKFSDSSGHDPGTRLFDVNGDSMPDLVIMRRVWDWDPSIGASFINNESHVYLNTGSTWVEDTGWTFPVEYTDGNGHQVNVAFLSQAAKDLGVRYTDVNGDGLTDLVWGGNGNTAKIGKTYLNTGSGWSYSSTWDLPLDTNGTDPITFVSPAGTENDARIADVNGDGLPDIIRSKRIYGPLGLISESHVYINDGSGWNVDTNWVWPADLDYDSTGATAVVFWTQSATDNGLRIADVNGDGLPDLLSSKRVWGSIDPCTGTSLLVTQFHVYINNGTGTGWTENTSWLFPFDYSYVQCSITYNIQVAFLGEQGNDTGLRLVDVNGDGLVDLLWDTYDTANTGHITTGVFINKGDGTGWGVKNTNWDFPKNYNSNTEYMFMLDNWQRNIQGVEIEDVNGDNLPDLIQSGYVHDSFQSKIYLANSNKPDLLSTINYNTGGKTDITYNGSSVYSSGGVLLNPNLPINLDTVAKMVTNDAGGHSMTTNYSYKGGRYYFTDPFVRKFSGFNSVTQTDSVGNTQKTFFHQGEVSDSAHGEYIDDFYKIGKPYRVEIYDNANNLYSKTINKWDDVNLGNGSKFIKLAQTVESTYDGDATHKDKAESYTYNNANGNQTQKVEYGEVTGSDDGTFADTGSDKFTTDISYASNATANILGLPSQSTTTDQSAAKVKESKFYYDTQTLGSVTKGNLTKQEDWKSGANYVSSQHAYNSYGLVTSDTDPRGKVTNYAYDTYNLYPATVTNPLSQATQLTYDYSSGQITQTTDPNTRVHQNIYDGLDRLIEEKQPDITAPGSLVTKSSYIYTDTPGAVSVHRTDNLDGTTARESYQYVDGLGRVIQQRIEAEGSNYEVTDKVYNNRGLLDKESLPYFSTGSSKTTATGTATLYNNYTYDPIQRVQSITNNLGTTSNIYNDWKLTVTDPNGKTKDLYKDVYGNLIQVDEHNGVNTYTTTYQYNLSNLTKITDALGNVRNFTYDGLGRRLTAQDLHTAADATFGTWTYTYDDAGNLTQSVDPKNQTVNYTYDNINRQLTEDYAGQSGTEVTNTYDSGTDGIGRLATTTSSAQTQVNTYNALGLLKRQVATLNAVNYQTDFDYDRAGNQILITNPDNSQVKYIYNSAGLLDQVQRKESTDASYTNVVSNFDYAPNEQVTIQANANGNITTNTYDATKLYRLTRKQTTGPGGGGSSTTTTFYPAAGDGSIYADNSNWNTGHNATSGTAVSYTGTTFKVGSGKSSSTNYRIERGFLPFNTAALPDNAVITSVKLKVLVDSKLNNDNDGDDWVTVTQGSEASTASLVVADYDNVGAMTNPVEGIDQTERKDISNVTTGQYLVFNLNNSGKGWISKTGNTLLALREGHDVICSSITATSGQYDQLTIRGSEYTGTTFDPVLEVTYYTTPPAPTVIQDASYTYDSNGNILSIVDASSTDTAKTTTYVYDDLNRLTSAVVTSAANSDNATKTYSYDAVGNIVTSSDLGTYTYAGTGYANPHAVTSVGGKTYAYDNNGNQTGDGTWTNTWNYQNRLTQSARTGTTVTYTYDPSGQRVKLSNGTTTTYYPTQLYDTDGTTAQKHIFANGVVVATVKGTGVAASVTSDHTDQLTGVGPVTNSSGAMVQLMDYYPYGTFRIDAQYGAGVDEQIKFAGQEYDRDTGLNYMDARYYNNSIGRFISQDPAFLVIGFNLLDPQSLNAYGYARNNPLKYNDPDGRSFHSFMKGAIEGVGSAVITTAAFTAFVAAAPVTLPASVITGLAVLTIANIGYDTYSNYTNYKNGLISRDQFDYNSGFLLSNTIVPLKLGTVKAGSEKPTIKLNTKDASSIVINVTSEGMLHTQKYHSLDSTLVNPLTGNKSYFNDFSEVEGLVKNSSGVQPVEQYGKLYREVEGNKNVGVDRGTKQQTSTYTVITDKLNNYINSFPGKANNLLKK